MSFDPDMQRLEEAIDALHAHAARYMGVNSRTLAATMREVNDALESVTIEYDGAISEADDECSRSSLMEDILRENDLADEIPN